jgi:hypothetical protein
MTAPSPLGRIEADLAYAAQIRRQHTDLTRRLTTERSHLQLLDERVRTLRDRLADEAKDVDALESFSPTRIWATLRGSHNDDLARERAEHEAARYAVAEAEARGAAVRRNVESLQAQLDRLGDVDHSTGPPLPPRRSGRSATTPPSRRRWRTSPGDAARSRPHARRPRRPTQPGRPLSPSSSKRSSSSARRSRGPPSTPSSAVDC